MHLRRRHSLFFVAALSGILAPVAVAKPGKTTIGKAAKATLKGPKAKTGLGERQAKLRYLSIPPAAWQPMMWTSQTKGTTAGTVSFNYVVAPVMLPDGAKIREVACFGDFDGNNNAGEAIRLREMPHDAVNGGAILAKPVIASSKQVQRAEAKLDHRVDNFSNVYQLEATFNGKPQLRGCRIGYTP